MARKTRKTRKPKEIVAATVNGTETKEARQARIKDIENKHKLNVLSAVESAVVDYGEALVADSWKGGGDPGDIPQIEASLALARANLNRHLLEVKRILLDNQYLTR